jgi:hypothetical protein
MNVISSDIETCSCRKKYWSSHAGVCVAVSVFSHVAFIQSEQIDKNKSPTTHPVSMLDGMDYLIYTLSSGEENVVFQCFTSAQPGSGDQSAEAFC